nr:immunoglobulin light chain junction region [Macaca mulatta]
CQQHGHWPQLTC